MRLSLWILSLLLSSSTAAGYARDIDVLALLSSHQESLDSAVSLVRPLIHSALCDTILPVFQPRLPQQNVLARESTIISSSLSMVEAVRASIIEPFPARRSGVDVVLQALVPVLVGHGAGICGVRRQARDTLRRASRMVEPLNDGLRGLVSEFARPIAGHVNFALFEVMVRAVSWRQSNLVDFLIRGFQSIGDVYCTGCLRPIDEPEVVYPSRESNLRSFADASEHLSKKARKAALNQGLWPMSINLIGT